MIEAAYSDRSSSELRLDRRPASSAGLHLIADATRQNLNQDRGWQHGDLVGLGRCKSVGFLNKGLAISGSKAALGA